jgi:hypothetical protein
VSDFDKLFRSQLRRLYQILRQTVPAELDIPISAGSTAEMANAGTMVRNV